MSFILTPVENKQDLLLFADIAEKLLKTQNSPYSPPWNTWHNRDYRLYPPLARLPP
jgi:hypothetical protein